MANTSGLIPFTERSPSELKELAKKGQKKSTEAKRKKKQLKEELEILLAMTDKNDKTIQEKICFALIKKASEGDTKAFEIVRDTIGQKPIERIEKTEVPKIVDDI